jgi:hypothetical protein
VGYAQLGLGVIEGRSAWLGGNFRLRGQLGSTGSDGWMRGETRGRLWVGRGTRLAASYTLGLSDAATGIDRYRLGGVPSSVLPTDWEWTRINAPVFDLGSARGANRESARVEFEQAGAVALFLERHRLSDDLSALGENGSTAVGFQGALGSEAESFQRLPGTRMNAGIGCRIENPVDGFAKKPCQDVDDYAFWASVQWVL